MNSDLLRFVDSISRDKNIEKESVFADMEAAMLSAARRVYGDADVVILLDRMSGDITATADGKPIDMKTLGRIAAQTAKQVMIQKFREDERNALFEEYSARVGEIITGTVSRYEAGGVVINLGRGEAFLPRSETIPGQTHQPGERIRGMILDVREAQNRVKIVLTQTHPHYIKKLFELEVPEVGERIIEIRALAREPGYRTKIAVTSIDSKVDAVGACVGVRGSRIRNIVDELGGEKIDIVRWNESSQVLITNALKPAEVSEVFLCFELGRATVIVNEDQLSLAIGKRGQNVRLGARLTGWDIDILTPEEYNLGVDAMEKTLKAIDGVEDVLLDKLLAIGVISLADLVAVGVDPLVQDLALAAELAARLVESAAAEAPRLAAEAAERKAREAAERKKRQEAEAGGGADAQDATSTEGDLGTDAKSSDGESAATADGEVCSDEEVTEPAEEGETPAVDSGGESGDDAPEAGVSTGDSATAAVGEAEHAEIEPAGEVAGTDLTDGPPEA